MELLALYLWLKLDVIQALMGFAVAGLVLATTAFGLYGIPQDSTYGDDKLRPREAAARRIAKRLGIAATLSLLAAVSVPSQKDAAILAGAYFALEAVHSPEGQKVTSLLRAKVNTYLDEQLTAAQAKGAK